MLIDGIVPQELVHFYDNKKTYKYWHDDKKLIK